MKTAYLVLGTAIALSAAALAGSGPPARGPDGSVETTHDAPRRGGRDWPHGRRHGPRRHSGRVTTTVRNGDNFASVTQSGNPETDVKADREAARLHPAGAAQRKRSAVIVQSNNVADLPLDKIPPAFREFFRR